MINLLIIFLFLNFQSEFMRDDYRVEQFVSDCRRRVPLEKLRRDLEEYFRLLKTAMVDLINKVSYFCVFDIRE